MMPWIRKMGVRIRRQLPTVATFGRQELVIALIFAIALPLPFFYHQSQAFNYVSGLWLAESLFAALAVGLAILYHLVLPTPAARLTATMVTTYLLTHDYNLREPVASTNVLAAFLPGKATLTMVIILVGGGYLAGRIVHGVARRFPALAPSALYNTAAAIAIVTLLFNSLSFFQYVAKHNAAFDYQVPHQFADVKLQPQPGQDRDVYYIVFDRYANASTLQSTYGYDNSPFLSQLRALGFNVRDDAHSNYQFTAPSIASTLQLDYLTDLQSKLAQETTVSYLPYRRLFEDNAAQALFKTAGYDVFNFSSWFGVTREMHQASNINPSFQLTLLGQTFLLSDLQDLILKQSIFGPLFRGGFGIGPIQLAWLNPAQTTQQMTNTQLEAITALAATPHERPRFVFAHVISPHPPYVFLPDGSSAQYDENDNSLGAPLNLKYTNQLQYLNTLIVKLVEDLQRSSSKPPIIILQADEGPYPQAYLDASQPAGISAETSGSYQWEKASDSDIKDKTAILSAFYLPDAPPDTVGQLNTPVNTFRYIFNTYFGATMPYLPDCTYLFNDAHPYDFFSVTNRIHENSSPKCEELVSGAKG